MIEIRGRLSIIIIYFLEIKYLINFILIIPRLITIFFNFFSILTYINIYLSIIYFITIMTFTIIS